MVYLGWALGSGLLIGVLGADGPAPLGAPEGDLAQAIGKTQLLKNYRFALESSFLGAKGRRDLVVEGIYEKDQPFWLKCGDRQAFRRGERILLKKGVQWVPDDRSSEATGDSLAKVPPPLRALREARVPAEEMPELFRACAEWKAGEEKEEGQTVYLGQMTPAATRAFGAGHEEASELSGTVRFWVGAEGQVTMYEVLVRGSSQNQRREERSAKYVRLTDPGTAVLVVPESVKKALEPESKP